MIFNELCDFARVLLRLYPLITIGVDAQVKVAVGRFLNIFWGLVDWLRCASTKQTHTLADLLSQTTAHATLLRSIEKLEIERDELQKQVEQHKEVENNINVLRNLKLSDVKTMLHNVTDQLNADGTGLLKDALASIVETITLNDEKMLATVQYKIAYNTGDKLASPRGFEPRSPP
jgi:hypothetical protein